MKWTLIGLALTLGIATESDAGYIYTQNFSVDAGGWTSDDFATWMPSGGVSNSAYLKGTRSLGAPNFQPSSGVAASSLLGKLEDVFGSRIKFSYYGRMFVGGDKSIGHYFSQNTPATGNTFWWNDNVETNFTPFKSEWTKVEFEIDTNWTDAEATANGWTRQIGTTSWADTLDNVTFNQWFYNWNSAGTYGTTHVGGIDEIRVEGLEAVPEPSTIAIWSILGCIGLFWFLCPRHKLRNDYHGAR